MQAHKPDWWIVRKRLSSDKKTVTMFEASFNGEQNKTFELFRPHALKAIENGVSFATLVEHNGNHSKGADVRLIEVNGVKFLRTDLNKTAADSLEELPEF